MGKFLLFFIDKSNGTPAVRWWWKFFLVAFLLLSSLEHGLSHWRGIFNLIGAVVFAIDLSLQYRKQATIKYN